MGEASTIRCAKCGYDLRATPSLKCPECGVVFDHASPARRAKRRRLLVSWLVMSLVMYAPYGWLLSMDYPWSDYRWHWIRMWPALPLFLVASAFRVGKLSRQLLHIEFDGPVAIAALSALSLLLLYGLVRLGARGWRWLIPAALVLLIFSIFNSLGLYGAFRM